MISIGNFAGNSKWFSYFSGAPQGQVSAKDQRAGPFPEFALNWPYIAEAH